MRKATIHDVAELAQVSAGTVSNFLNRPSYVSPDLRDRIRTAISKLDYEPRQSARQFRPGRVKNIGLILADMANPFFVGIALGAQEIAREAGVGLVICNSSENPTREIENINLLVQQRAQGIVLSLVDENSERLLALLNREIPVVLVDRVPKEVSLCSVSIHDGLGGELAGEYLGSKGFRLIGFVGDLEVNPKVRLRMEGVQTGAAIKGSSVCHIAVHGWTRESGTEGARIWSAMSPDDRPKALVCANDMVALGLIQELWKHGFSIPKDVSVIGYDDLDMAESNTIPLSTIRQPRSLLGKTALDLILREIEEGESHVHKRVVLTPSLVLRETA